MLLCCLTLAAPVRSGTVDRRTAQEIAGEATLPEVIKGEEDLYYPDCRLPPVLPSTHIVLLSTDSPAPDSSVWIGKSQDEAWNGINQTWAGIIDVEPGTEPIAIIISTRRPTIWQFRGATQRIQWVVLTTFLRGRNSKAPVYSPPLAGVVGLPRERVRFLPKYTCLSYFDRSDSYAAQNAAADVKHYLGRPPDTVAATYSASGFRVPSGEVLKFLSEREAQAQGPDFAPYYTGPPRPLHVVRFDPDTIVASQPVTQLEWGAGKSGLERLVRDGALVRIGPSEYRVKRLFRFPKNLDGDDAVTVWVPKDVPIPWGPVGEICVISEQDGRSLVCERQDRPAKPSDK